MDHLPVVLIEVGDGPRRVWRHERGEGLGLSLLFPAVTALYRRLGWEQAGDLVRHRLEARRAPAGFAPGVTAAVPRVRPPTSPP